MCCFCYCYFLLQIKELRPRELKELAPAHAEQGSHRRHQGTGMGTPCARSSRAHLSLGTGFEPELAQDMEQRQLDLQEPQSHPEAAPGTCPERQVREGPLVLPSLGCEPMGQHGQRWPGSPPPFLGLQPLALAEGPHHLRPRSHHMRPKPHLGLQDPVFSWTGQSLRLWSWWPLIHVLQSGSPPPVLQSPKGTAELVESPGSSALPSLPLLMNSLWC